MRRTLRLLVAATILAVVVQGLTTYVIVSRAMGRAAELYQSARAADRASSRYAAWAAVAEGQLSQCLAQW